MPHLLRLPLELLENIAFELVAATPLGPPSQLLPLLSTAKHVHAALSMSSGTALWARICRHKFDTDAAARRGLALCTKDYNEHLKQMCTMLNFLRAGDIYHEDAPDQFMTAYLAMLDNDGKNRAQLEAARAVDFVDRYMYERLYEGRERNDMWPVENEVNACVLWLKWMLSTRERLQQETPEQRAEVVRLLLPILVCPHRYPSALAPANHFALPLNRHNQVQKNIYQVSTAHSPYPNYYTHDNGGTYQCYYFRTNISVIAPLIAPVAALLFWSRRELNGLREVPSVLPVARNPPGRLDLTQEDIHEVNAHKVAKLPPTVLWDWERGAPTVHADDGSIHPWRENDSVRWDLDLMRLRICHSVFAFRKFRLGEVYLRGLMSGLWQGIQGMQSHEVFDAVLNHTQLYLTVTEETTMYSGQPMMFRMKEHGFVRTLAQRKDMENTAVPHASPGYTNVIEDPETSLTATAVSVDISIGNAWFPGPPGSLKWVPDNQPVDAGVLQDQYVRSTDDSKRGMSTLKVYVSDRSGLASSTGEWTAEAGGPADAASVLGHSGKVYQYETYDPLKESVHERMVRAKEALALSSVAKDGNFLQHPGCLRCAERAAYLADRRQRAIAEMEDRLVDEAFASVGMGNRSRSSDVVDDHDEDGDESDEDSDIVEVHLGEVVDEEAGHESISSDIRPPSSPPPQPPADLAEILDDLPLYSAPKHNLHELDGTEDLETDSDIDLGHEGVVDSAGKIVYEPITPSLSIDKCEKCDDGVEDVILTGEMDERHRCAWGRSVYYGRVRPWDGMIALLRIAYNHYSPEPSSHTVFYGYIYGEDTFVGNWKYAGMSDPLAPSFECAFVMSRRPDNPTPAT